MAELRADQIIITQVPSNPNHVVRLMDLGASALSLIDIETFRYDGGLVASSSDIVPFTQGGKFQDIIAPMSGKIIMTSMRITSPWLAGQLNMGITVNGSRLTATTLNLVIKESSSDGEAIFFDNTLNQIRTGDSGTAVTFDHTGDLINCVAHGLETDDVIYFSTSNTLPAEISLGTYYSIEKQNNDSFKLFDPATGLILAFTDDGVGIHKFHEVDTPHGLSTNDIVRFATDNVLPAELSTGTNYYAIVIDDYAFQVEASIGGGVVAFTDDGVGNHVVYDEFEHEFTYSDYAGPSSTVVTFDHTSNIVEQISHGFVDNDIIYFSSDGLLPSELSSGVEYFVIRINDDTYEVSASFGGLAIVLSDNGTGVHYVTQKNPYVFDQLDKIGIILDTDASWNPEAAGIECKMYISYGV